MQDGKRPHPITKVHTKMTGPGVSAVQNIRGFEQVAPTQDGRSRRMILDPTRMTRRHAARKARPSVTHGELQARVMDIRFLAGWQTVGAANAHQPRLAPGKRRISVCQGGEWEQSIGFRPPVVLSVSPVLLATTWNGDPATTGTDPGPPPRRNDLSCTRHWLQW